MTDDVTIKFTADTSDLQSGMQDAAASVNATAGTMRAGAAQIAASFGALSQAYANGTAQKLQVAQQASEQMETIAREQENASYQIALNGVKMNQALVKEEVQTAQMSHEQELASLLAFEDQRESIERQHWQTLQAMPNTSEKQYEAYQEKLDTLASQGALRREQIELAYNKEVYNDYRRTFEQIGSSVSSSIMGMIEGHETLRQAAQKVLLSIIQDFIQARIKMVADWAAGVATQVTVTQAGEAAKTAAVTTGVAARSAAENAGAAGSLAASAGSMITQIGADAKAAAAGVFAFLAPVMGPGAAAPAAAAEGSVMSFASFDTGSWQLPADMIAQVHQGEMIVPAGATPWAQGLMSHAAGGSGAGGGVTVNHATHFNIQAMDSQDVKRWFKSNGKTVMRTINDSVRYGAHLGMSKLA